MRKRWEGLRKKMRGSSIFFRHRSNTEGEEVDRVFRHGSATFAETSDQVRKAAMDNRNSLQKIKAELARQDAIIADAMRRLNRLGDIQIILPTEMLQKLQELQEARARLMARANSSTTLTLGLRV
jgi:hypothetical protein